MTIWNGIAQTQSSPDIFVFTFYKLLCIISTKQTKCKFSQSCARNSSKIVWCNSINRSEGDKNGNIILLMFKRTCLGKWPPAVCQPNTLNPSWSIAWRPTSSFCFINSCWNCSGNGRGGGTGWPCSWLVKVSSTLATDGWHSLRSDQTRVATMNLRRFLERLIKESIIKGEG